MPLATELYHKARGAMSFNNEVYHIETGLGTVLCNSNLDNSRRHTSCFYSQINCKRCIKAAKKITKPE